jgi:microsomal dipeptidase-like Zn-dependent dipeptidase
MMLETARRVHADLPVVDGHNDLPWAIRIHHGGLDNADTTGPLPGRHTDTARLLAGGVGGQFWSVYVPAWDETPFTTTLEQIDLVTSNSYGLPTGCAGRAPRVASADCAGLKVGIASKDRSTICESWPHAVCAT